MATKSSGPPFRTLLSSTDIISILGRFLVEFDVRSLATGLGFRADSEVSKALYSSSGIDRLLAHCCGCQAESESIICPSCSVFSVGRLFKNALATQGDLRELFSPCDSEIPDLRGFIDSTRDKRSPCALLLREDHWGNELSPETADYWLKCYYSQCNQQLRHIVFRDLFRQCGSKIAEILDTICVPSWDTYSINLRYSFKNLSRIRNLLKSQSLEDIRSILGKPLWVILQQALDESEVLRGGIREYGNFKGGPCCRVTPSVCLS